jgi:hypothetical protein
VLLAAPSISRLKETAKIWREGSALAHVSAGTGKKKRLPVGTTFSFGLNQPASVIFSFTQWASGRKVGKRCVSQTEKNKNRRHCAHTIIAGTLTLSGHAGTNKLRFQGRISRARKLKPGRYKLIVTATNAAGQRSTPRSLTFTILRR